MRVKIIRHQCGKVSNIFSKQIDCTYEYFIALVPWLKPKRYVKLLPGWFEALNNDQPCKVELTRKCLEATSFRDGNGCYRNLACAKTIVGLMKSNPDKFILN